MSTDVGVQVPSRAQIPVSRDTFSCRVLECTLTHGGRPAKTRSDLHRFVADLPLCDSGDPLEEFAGTAAGRGGRAGRPPQSLLQELVHGPLVTNRVVRPADDDLVYGLCSVGDGGRILDKITFTALDWRPGMRLELTCPDARVLLARPVPAGGVHDRGRVLPRSVSAAAPGRSVDRSADPADRDADQCLVYLRKKDGTDGWQPVSPTLMRRLLEHAAERHSPRSGQLLRYRNGRPSQHGLSTTSGNDSARP